MTIESRATAYVESYIDQGFEEAYQRIETLRRGEGCQCLNCLKQAVREVNEWIDLLAIDVSDVMHYGLQGKHILILMPGESPLSLPPYFGG